MMHAATKLKRNRKGLTLIEVLVAVFILAIVIVPLLGVFASNLRVVQHSGKIIGTSFAAQSLSEEVSTLNYAELFAAQRSNAPYDGVTATVKVVPSGTSSGLVSGAPCFAHLTYTGTKTIFVGPDGQYFSQSGTASDITLSASSTGYSLTGGISLSGTKPNKPLILLVNTGSSSLPAITLTLNNAACALYKASTQTVEIKGATAKVEYPYNTGGEPIPLLIDITVQAGDGESTKTVQSTVEKVAQ